MARQRVITSLVVVLAFACAANAGFAQTQATTGNGPQTSADQGQSAAALAQEASNPFATSWLMQLQQNNNLAEMPRGDDHTRVQSNLVFQPLMSLRLTEKQGLVVRPMVTILTFPHFDQSGQNERTVGFGDTVLAFALPRSLLGGDSPSAQARRSSSLRHRRICSARTPGSWGLMREPRFSASTSSPTPSCSNGSRSAETAGTRTT